MNNFSKNSDETKKALSIDKRWELLGILIAWAASIALALQIKTLLTPGNYPVGSDPSFDLTLAAFLFLLFLLGALLLGRGLLAERNRLTTRLEKTLNRAAWVILGLSVLVFLIGGLLLSADTTFAAKFRTMLWNEPRPDYSLPEFPTPVVATPAPTFDPNVAYFSGSILSSMDGLRVGDIWISTSPSGDTILSVQVSMQRTTCSVQEGQAVTSFAVEKSQQLISGPVPIQDGYFYAGQPMASVHGVFPSPQEAHGTLYLRYLEPGSNRACDLGNFEWSASRSK